MWDDIVTEEDEFPEWAPDPGNWIDTSEEPEVPAEDPEWVEELEEEITDGESSRV